MDLSDRPPMPQIMYDQIDMILYQVDQRHWRNLAGMQVPNKLPAGEPRPPQIPGQLLNQLQWYASVLFTREVEQYGAFRKNPQYPLWLQCLADRILARVLNAVDEIDKANSEASLRYHGLRQDKAAAGITELLTALVNKYTWEASDEYSRLKEQSAAAAQNDDVSAMAPTETPISPKATELPDLKKEIARRVALLADYKTATGNPSNKKICEARNSGIYRPQFYDWLNGKLPANSKTAKAFESFLRSKRRPIPRKPTS